MYKDKSKKHAQTQQLYDMLKKKVLTRQVETAASDNVTHTLQSMNTQQRPATYQNQSFNHGISPQKAMSDNGQFEELAMPQYQKQGPARAPLGHSPQDMAPPPRPVRSRGIGESLILSPKMVLMRTATAATPQHRTVLPGAARPTANRSQIPMSSARVDTRHSLNIPHASQSSSLRHQLPMDGPINRISTSTPRGYGGISSGMKVGTGRAGTAGDVIGNSRYGQHEGRSSNCLFVSH